MEIEQTQQKLARQQLALKALEHLEWVELTFVFSDDCPEEIKKVFLRGDIMADAMQDAEYYFAEGLEDGIQSMYFGDQQDEEYWGHWNGEESEVKDEVK